MKLRTIMSILGGFVTMAVMVIVFTPVSVLLILGRPVPGEVLRPTTLYLVVNLVFSLVSAIAGGYVCAWIAGYRSMIAVMGLGAFVAMMSILSALTPNPQGGEQPIWYPYVIGLTGLVGCLLGGMIRMITSRRK